MGNPFPFCDLCATWHTTGKHINPYWKPQRRQRRIEFWYGWIWGLSCGLFVGLIVACFVYAGG